MPTSIPIPPPEKDIAKLFTQLNAEIAQLTAGQQKAIKDILGKLSARYRQLATNCAQTALQLAADTDWTINRPGEGPYDQPR